MKKISAEFVLMMLCGALGITSALVGITCLIASIFTPLPVFNGFVLLIGGVILICVVRLYYVFLDVLNKTAEAIETISKIIDIKTGTSPQMYPGTNSNIISHEIKIDDTTSPEEIEDIKKKFPMLADGIDSILNKINPNLSPLPKAIELLSLAQLEKELKKAVGEDNFERATEIRNEINKRKQKK